MALSTQSTPKRARVSGSDSESMRFSLSPLRIKRADAISAKIQDPSHTELRRISIAPLTTEEAMVEQAEGCTVCLSPCNTKSNKSFSVMAQQHHLYVNLLGSSPKVCEVDLVAFVLKHLDYFLKQAVAEALMCPATSQDFEMALLGPYKERPFQSTDGNSLRYSRLLTFVDRMKSRAMDSHAAARLSIYEDLLSTCENKLLAALGASGAEYSQHEKDTLVQHIREELIEFLHGEMKGDRDIASHIFCDLLWVDTRAPLSEHDFHDPYFPGLRYTAFDFSRHARVEAMALKVLILKDLQAKFDSNRIGKFTHEVTKAAFKLVYSCVQRNVDVSKKVVCGDMHAVIPGQKEGLQSDVVELDPLSSMTLLQ